MNPNLEQEWGGTLRCFKNGKSVNIADELNKLEKEVNAIPRPDFTHIHDVKISIDNSPKVKQPYVEITSENDSDLGENYEGKYT